MTSLNTCHVVFAGTTRHESVRVLRHAGVEARQPEEGDRTLLDVILRRKHKVVLRFQKRAREKNSFSCVSTSVSVLTL